MAIPLLATVDLTGRVLTADAMHTQRALAEYLVARGADYHFTVKSNQPTLERDIALLFAAQRAPDYVDHHAEHGRIETRRIWCSTALNDYLDFPHVGQVFRIEREVIEKKTGAVSCETALGVTSQHPNQASPKQVLTTNRGYWRIEALHYLLDWNYDEDRSRIRSGYAPENVTRLRRFAIGVLKQFQKPRQSIAGMMRALCLRPRLVFDYLRMTQNSNAPAR